VPALKVYAFSPGLPWHQRFPFKREAWRKHVLLVRGGVKGKT